MFMHLMLKLKRKRDKPEGRECFQLDGECGGRKG